MSVHADDFARHRVRQATRNAIDLISALSTGDDARATALTESIRSPYVTAYLLASVAAGFLQDAAESGGISVHEALEHLAQRMEQEMP